VISLLPEIEEEKVGVENPKNEPCFRENHKVENDRLACVNHKAKQEEEEDKKLPLPEKPKMAFINVLKSCKSLQQSTLSPVVDDVRRHLLLHEDTKVSPMALPVLPPKTILLLPRRVSS
jgi:hypothetical protein